MKSKKKWWFYLPKQRPTGTDVLQLLSPNWLLFTFNGRPFALLMSTPVLSKMLFALTILSLLCPSKNNPLTDPWMVLNETTLAAEFTNVAPARSFALKRFVVKVVAVEE